MFRQWRRQSRMLVCWKRQAWARTHGQKGGQLWKRQAVMEKTGSYGKDTGSLEKTGTYGKDGHL